MKSFISVFLKISKFFSIFFILVFLNCFANEDDEKINEKKSLVNLGNSESFFSQKKNKSEICSFLNNKLVTYVDLIYIVKDCKLSLLKDAEVSNQLIQDQRKKIIALPVHVYAMLEIGKEYNSDDYYRDYLAKNADSFHILCNKYEKEILTSNNEQFFYIEECKKREFNKFSDIELFLSKSKPIYSVDQKVLNRFKQGSPIQVNKKIDNTIIKVPEEEQIADLPSTKVLCAKLERKVVAFHEGFFFVQDCKLLTISDFNIEIQRKADELGGIKELTVKQAIGLPQIGIIKSSEVLKKMR
ncbi:hypothetical protein ACWNT8_02635 [Pigmentibacter ruber]|nr:hypothetical protein GTC16762_03920 [Pigmentibacter ruber]